MADQNRDNNRRSSRNRAYEGSRRNRHSQGHDSRGRDDRAYYDDPYDDANGENGSYDVTYYDDGYPDETGYYEDFDREYERLREQNDRLRDKRADERAAEAGRRRRARREQEIRRAKARLAIAAALTAAVVILVVLGIRFFTSGGLQLFHRTEATAEAAEVVASVAEASTEAATEEDTEPQLTPEQIEADRKAKNYSAAVATFWPYYTFHTTDQTEEIPSIPSVAQGYEQLVAQQQAAQAEAAAAGASDENVVGTEAAENATADSSAEAATDTGEAGTDAQSDTTTTEAAAGSSTEDTTSAGTIENTLEAEAVEASGESTTDAAAGSTVVTAVDGSNVPPEDQVGGDYVASYYGIVVDVDNGDILAQKHMNDRIVPASMTKVMTLLTAVETLGLTENSSELEDMVTLTTEDEEYAYINGSSAVCWMPGDTASVEDLMYGTILPSGADAAVALSEYVSGSQDAFVKLMNQKAEELGIGATTHFTNCVGVYDEDHYSTVYDIAVIMKAALENDLCRKILSGHVWTTSPTSVHPEGITVSNWFLRRIEDRETNGLVLCAKTGFVNQSGFCAVSYQECDDGSHLIVCTAHSSGNWRCINDHVALYREYAKPVATQTE